MAQFAERVPLVKGRVDQRASTAAGNAWIVWEKPLADHTRLVWIPGTPRALERDSDYSADPIRTRSNIPGNVSAAVGTGQGDLFGVGADEPDLRRGEAVS